MAPLNYLDVSAISLTEFQRLAHLDQAARSEAVAKRVVTGAALDKVGREQVRATTPIDTLGELACIVLFALGVPGSVFVLPVLTVLVGLALGRVRLVCTLALVAATPLAFWKVKFDERRLYSWLSWSLLRYFSFKVLFEETIPPQQRAILVAPPHGLFPFGNILTMVAFPSLMGYSFHGLASSAAFYCPVFSQLLTWVGAVDASRKSAEHCLRSDRVIGISTGGVAEVFETDADRSDGPGDECVVLRSRKGMVKLALRTGSPLVPCYLFGNTKLLDLHCGSGATRDLVRSLSRRLGVATVLFWGRFFLPVPYRVPILGVMGQPIQVTQTDEPTQTQIDETHAILLERMKLLFDKHKHRYGWGQKRLVIK